MKMKSVIVTGGAGFIGSAVCRHLIGEGYRVLNVDKLTYAADLENLQSIEEDEAYSFVQADICDKPKMLELMRSTKCTAVVHLAAESHVDRSIEDAAEFVNTNVVGTVSMLEAAHAHWSEQGQPQSFRFLHVSTDEVFGDLDFTDEQFVETSRYKPSSPYSASKAASDHFVNAWHRTYGLPCLISNCSNNYGPHQFPEKLIPLMITNAVAGKPLPVYGNGMNVRDWLYVEDHAIALQTILERGKVGETYNVGGHNEYSNIEVVKTICERLDKMRPRNDGTSYAEQITYVTDRPGHDLRYAIDATKIGKELGWMPKTTFPDGISQTIEWYLSSK